MSSESYFLVVNVRTLIKYSGRGNEVGGGLGRPTARAPIQSSWIESYPDQPNLPSFGGW